MKLIAFCGPKQSGKSTVATVHLLLKGWTHLPFAGPLKSMLEAVGVPHECLWGSRKEEPLDLLLGQTARHAMKELGEAWGRQRIHQDIWVHLWKMRLQRMEEHAPFVVDDLRYPNEFEAVKSFGGVVIRVKREGYEYSTEHASEMHELPADYVVENVEGKPEVVHAWLDEFLVGELPPKGV